MNINRQQFKAMQGSKKLRKDQIPGKDQIPAHWLIGNIPEAKGQRFLPYLGSEDAFQITFANYMRQVYPSVLCFHVANERDLRHKTKVTAAGRKINLPGKKLLDKGVLSGVPDNIIPGWQLAIELKVGTNTLTENQFQVMGWFEKSGWMVFVSWSFDECRWLLDFAADQQ